MFRLDRVPTTLNLTILYTVVNEHNQPEKVPVTHILRLPTLQEREQFERDSTKIRGRKLDFDRRRAALRLWPKIVMDVKGYADIEEQFPRDGAGNLTGDWRGYFLQNPILQQHVTDFIDQMFEQISGEEGDLEKNSES